MSANKCKHDWQPITADRLEKIFPKQDKNEVEYLECGIFGYSCKKCYMILPSSDFKDYIVFEKMKFDIKYVKLSLAVSFIALLISIFSLINQQLIK